MYTCDVCGVQYRQRYYVINVTADASDLPHYKKQSVALCLKHKVTECIVQKEICVGHREWDGAAGRAAYNHSFWQREKRENGVVVMASGGLKIEKQANKHGSV